LLFNLCTFAEKCVLIEFLTITTHRQVGFFVSYVNRYLHSGFKKSLPTLDFVNVYLEE